MHVPFKPQLNCLFLLSFELSKGKHFLTLPQHFSFSFNTSTVFSDYLYTQLVSYTKSKNLLKQSLFIHLEPQRLSHSLDLEAPEQIFEA